MAYGSDTGDDISGTLPQTAGAQKLSEKIFLKRIRQTKNIPEKF